MSKFSVPEDVLTQCRAAKYEFVDGILNFSVKGGKVPVQRFLTRTLKLTDKFKDDEIRDMAKDIEATLDPKGRVVVCEKPEDYTKMYKAGSSCMVVAGSPGSWSSAYVGKIGLEILKRYQLWSTMWYHYNPHSEGFYFEKGGVPVGRCFLLNRISLGTQVGTGLDAIERFIKEQYDIKKFSNAGYGLKITEDFVIPGIAIDDKYYGPIPNCDNFAKPFFVGYDKEIHSFTYSGVAKKGFTAIANTYNYPQWISEDQCKEGFSNGLH